MTTLNQQLHAARAAAPVIASLDGERKRALIRAMAQALAAARDVILTANARDVDAASAAEQSTALIDRMRLNPARLETVVAALAHNAPQIGRAWGRESRGRNGWNSV